MTNFENCALCGHPHPREYIAKLNRRITVQAELTAKEPGKLTDASGGRGKSQQVGTPTVIHAAENAAKVVEGWSDAKKEYAGRLMGGTNFCGHGVMASICPTCAVPRPHLSTPEK